MMADPAQPEVTKNAKNHAPNFLKSRNNIDNASIKHRVELYTSGSTHIDQTK